MISMHPSIGGPRLGLRDNRLAALCDSSIVRATYERLPPDVACDESKLLAAAAVLTRLYGRVDIDAFARIARESPLAIDGLSALVMNIHGYVLGIETHAEFYESQVFVRQDYLVNMLQYLLAQGVKLPVDDIAYQPEFNHFGEIGVWVSPVRLTNNDKYIVV